VKLFHGTVLAAAALATAMCVVVACNDSTPPTAPVGGTPAPVAGTPAPAPSTTPTPTPTPSAAVAACTVGPMPDCAADCCDEAEDGLFDDEIVNAIAAVRRENPDWFGRDDQIQVSAAEYTNAVAGQITKLYGLCARGGDKPGPPVGHSISEDEVAIKRDNRLSQNVDIIYGNGQAGIIRYFNCRPASF